MTERKILYVEDNEYNRKIVRQLLKRSACRLIEAADGETGVALAPGVDFDPVDGHRWVRFSFAGAADDVHGALGRLGA